MLQTNQHRRRMLKRSLQDLCVSDNSFYGILYLWNRTILEGKITVEEYGFEVLIELNAYQSKHVHLDDVNYVGFKNGN